MKRLMVLGGSVAQLGAVRTAKTAGHHVIVADRDPDALGKSEADEFVQASTFDEQEVLAAARRTRPDGLLVVATDQPVLIAARVCDTLGLGYPLDPETALLVTNKGHMKRRLSEAGIPTPAYTLVEAPGRVATRGCPDLAELSPPLVVKPVDNQGQRGVTLCKTPAAALTAVERARTFSRQSAVLVEEYYPSREITVSGWVTGGNAQILTVTDRVTIDHPTSLGVCAAHRFPSSHARGHETEIADLTRRVAQAFGISAGPIYFQMLIGDGGTVVNEVACRIGGAFEDHSLPLVTGVDILGRGIAECLGAPIQPLPDDGRGQAPTTGAFCVPLLYCEPGTIARLSELAPARRIPGVRALEWLQPVGREIHRMRDSSQRVGFAVVHGPDASAVNAAVRRMFAALAVTSSDGRRMLMDTLDLCLHPE